MEIGRGAGPTTPRRAANLVQKRYDLSSKGEVTLRDGVVDVSLNIRMGTRLIGTDQVVRGL
jgi:hypothetical protein